MHVCDAVRRLQASAALGRAADAHAYRSQAAASWVDADGALRSSCPQFGSWDDEANAADAAADGAVNGAEGDADAVNFAGGLAGAASGVLVLLCLLTLAGHFVRVRFLRGGQHGARQTTELLETSTTSSSLGRGLGPLGRGTELPEVQVEASLEDPGSRSRVDD